MPYTSARALLAICWALAAAVPGAGPASATADRTPQGLIAQVPTGLADYLAGDRTDLQWSLASGHLSQAWNLSTGEGVTVAVIDTGVDRSAPDLAGQTVDEAHADASGTIVPGYVTDHVGHGTHVAGIIAATRDGAGMTGVAPDSTVLPIALGSNLTTESIAAAIRYAAAHGAKVANLSLGEPDLPYTRDDAGLLCQAVADVADTTLVVVAAGNDGLGLNPASLPADCPGAMSVSAVDASLTPTAWSSYDETVAVAAPGDDIFSTVPRRVSPAGYASYSGTSMAAPYVAGVAALVFAEHPAWTVAQVRDRIASTALDVAPVGIDPRTGHGVVDPAAAVGEQAPAPAAVSHLPAFGGIFPESDGVEAFTYVAWSPDPSLVVTGYRITRWTQAGPTTRDVAANVVRSTFDATPAFYQVTALSAGEPVAGTPFYAALTPDPAPAERLRATYLRSGSLRITWVNPPANADTVTGYAVLLDGAPVAVGEPDDGIIPTSATAPARDLPEGDFSVAVVYTTDDLTEATTEVAVRSRLPFTASLAKAGAGRYRAYVHVSPLWARAHCGSSTCAGTRVRVSVAGRTYVTHLDTRGQLTVVFRYRGTARVLGLGVVVPSHRGLNSAYAVHR